MNTNNFSSMQERFKKFEKDKGYSDMEEFEENFDSEGYIPDDINLIDPIAENLKVTKFLYRYSNILVEQTAVIEEIKKEFKIWWSNKYHLISNEKSRRDNKIIPRTKEQIESKIISENIEQYKYYMNKIKQEEYKLGLIENVAECLRSYSFKIQNITPAVFKKLL